MSAAPKEVFQVVRPAGFSGRGDKYLSEIAQALRRALCKAQRTHAFAGFRLPETFYSNLAILLVEWAEDLHNDLGLWRTVEAHHVKYFGTPLPLVLNASEKVELGQFDSRRIRFLLWNLWSAVYPASPLAPDHDDFKHLADAATRLLSERFAHLPKDSGIQHFLSTPNQFGWEIKRKLVWMGTQSYLFRDLFRQYLDLNELEGNVTNTDDFVCQNATGWSGLGVIDVLAGALPLPEEDRATIRSWYERHWSFYRILAWHQEGDEVKTLTARNLVNGQEYTVRMNNHPCPFAKGSVVLGALIPWRGEWYWSGEQRVVDGVSPADEASLRQGMMERSSLITYRFCPTEAARAREFTAKFHAEFVAHHKDDLIVFPDGTALAAAEEQRTADTWAKLDPETAYRLMQERGLTKPGPQMDLPADLLNHTHGIAAFYNPAEGVEYLSYFNETLSALRKRGVDLSSQEAEILRETIFDPAISPAFIRRLVREHGAESFAAAFQMQHCSPDEALEFLLRRHKGVFFRNRYPTLSITGVPPMEESPAKDAPVANDKGGEGATSENSV